MTAGSHGLKDIINSASGLSTKQAGDYFGWVGRGVTKKAGDFTKAGLIEKGFTKDVLKRLADAYDDIAKLPSPSGNFNPSAASRAQQLRDILDELF